MKAKSTALLLIILIFLTGCEMQKYKAYIELSDYDGVTAFEKDGKYIRDNLPDEFVVYSEEDFENLAKPIELEFMGKTYTVKYDFNRLTYSSKMLRKYVNEDETIEFTIDDETKKVFEIRYIGNESHATNENFFEHNKCEIDEKAMYDEAYRNLSQFIPISKYTYIGVQSLGLEGTVTGFVVDDSQARRQYKFNFVTQIDGIECEKATVVFNNNGYICDMSFIRDENFDKFADLKIDRSEINKAIDTRINQRFSGKTFYTFELEDKIKFSSYEITNSNKPKLKLSKDGNHLYVVVEVKLYFEGNGFTQDEYKNMYVKIN